MPAGVVDDRNVEMVDLAPTIAELLEVDTRDALQKLDSLDVSGFFQLSLERPNEWEPCAMNLVHRLEHAGDREVQLHQWDLGAPGFSAIITLEDHREGTKYTATAIHRDEEGSVSMSAPKHRG